MEKPQPDGESSVDGTQATGLAGVAYPIEPSEMRRSVSAYNLQVPTAYNLPVQVPAASTNTRRRSLTPHPTGHAPDDASSPASATSAASTGTPTSSRTSLAPSPAPGPAIAVDADDTVSATTPAGPAGATGAAGAAGAAGAPGSPTLEFADQMISLDGKPYVAEDDTASNTTTDEAGSFTGSFTAVVSDAETGGAGRADPATPVTAMGAGIGRMTLTTPPSPAPPAYNYMYYAAPAPHVPSLPATPAAAHHLPATRAVHSPALATPPAQRLPAARAVRVQAPAPATPERTPSTNSVAVKGSRNLAKIKQAFYLPAILLIHQALVALALDPALSPTIEGIHGLFQSVGNIQQFILEQMRLMGSTESVPEWWRQSWWVEMGAALVLACLDTWRHHLLTRVPGGASRWNQLRRHLQQNGFLARVVGFVRARSRTSRSNIVRALEGRVPANMATALLHNIDAGYRAVADENVGKFSEVEEPPPS